MKIIILGAAGFIGTNLALKLFEDHHELLLVDEKKEYFNDNPVSGCEKVTTAAIDYTTMDGLDIIMRNSDIVYHLISTTNPTTSNKNINNEISVNISYSTKILDACVKEKVKRVIFISSGGTVYGKGQCPLSETDSTDPITTYGIQKLAIEKLLYLYSYIYGLDYRIVRLSNPYGPYQRPDGKLGAVTTFTYKAINRAEIKVYGDGSVVRDYIYIDDAVNAIMNITFRDCEYKLYNVGSGVGTSLNELLTLLAEVVGETLTITYSGNRSVDLKENYLSIERYENEIGRIVHTDLKDGIKKTADFLCEYIFMKNSREGELIIE